MESNLRRIGVTGAVQWGKMSLLFGRVESKAPACVSGCPCLLAVPHPEPLSSACKELHSPPAFCVSYVLGMVLYILSIV